MRYPLSVGYGFLLQASLYGTDADVIANSMAALTGTGTINGGSQTYNFLVTGVNGGGIQSTNPSNNNAVIYDTQPGAAATATPTTSVTGNVLVHN